jgi:hypothetical protein
VEKDLLCDAAFAVCEVGFQGPTNDHRTLSRIWIQPQGWLQMDPAIPTRWTAWAQRSIEATATLPAPDFPTMVGTDTPTAPAPSKLGQQETGSVFAQTTSLGSPSFCPSDQRLAQANGAEPAEAPSLSSGTSIEPAAPDGGRAKQPRVDSRFQRLVSDAGWSAGRTVDRAGFVQSVFAEHPAAQRSKLGAGPPRIYATVWQAWLPGSHPCGQRRPLWIDRSSGPFAFERVVDSLGDSSGIYRSRTSRTKWRTRTDASGVQGRNDTACVGSSASATTAHGSMGPNLQPSATARSVGSEDARKDLSPPAPRPEIGQSTVPAFVAGAARSKQWTDQVEGKKAICRRSVHWVSGGTQASQSQPESGLFGERPDRRDAGDRFGRDASGTLCPTNREVMRAGSYGIGGVSIQLSRRAAFWYSLRSGSLRSPSLCEHQDAAIALPH